MKIFEVSASGLGPGGICYQVMEVVGTKFYCLLGQRASSSKPNAVYIFDMVKKEWQEIENPKGAGPTPRAMPASCVVGNKIYVFGGYSQATPVANHTVYNGMYSFDIETNTWTHIECNGLCPDPRAGAQMWQYKGKIYLVGGCQGRQLYFTSLYEYNIEENIWKTVETKGYVSLSSEFNTIVNSSNQNESKTQCPERFCCFSASAIENLVYIFGGLFAREEMDKHTASNAMFVLDMETLEWVKPVFADDNNIVPGARASHTMTTVGPNLILVGGCNVVNNTDYDQHVYLFNILERKWYRLTDFFFGSHMPKLVGLASAYCKETKEIFYLGGKGSDDVLKNHFYLIDTKLVKQINDYSFEPSTSESINRAHRKSIRALEDIKTKDKTAFNSYGTRDKRSKSSAVAYSPLPQQDTDEDDSGLLNGDIKTNRRRTVGSITKLFRK
nr:unnamed protein product [Naegleria fowleri]